MYMWRAMDAAAQCIGIGAKKTDDKQEFENQPVVGLHKVDSLWHLHLARPGNVAQCE